MGYLLKYRTKTGPVAFAFERKRKDDAFKQATAALETGAKDVELLDNGKPVPRSEWKAKAEA